MRISKFPDCCGAYNISDFGWTEITEGTTNAINKDFIRKRLKYYCKDYGHIAFLIAVLNKSQVDGVGNIFEEFNFKEVATGYNSNHKCMLHTYIRCNNNIGEIHEEKYNKIFKW